MLTFSELAKGIFPFCSDGQNIEDYILALIERLMETPTSCEDIHKANDGTYNPLASLQANTIRKIYNGSRTISSQNAAIIIKHLDKAKFQDYINELSGDALFGICTVLAGLGITSTPLNAGMICANAFEKVLTDCSKSSFRNMKQENDNELSSDKDKLKISDVPITTVYVRDGKIHIGDTIIALPAKQSPPDEIAPEETVYVTELLKAYADAEKVPEITKESLLDYPGKYRRNFQEQRRYYYDAENIRNSLREVFGEEEMDLFDILKNETYDGIIEVFFEDYEHGYARLLSALKEVSRISTDKSVLCKIQNWIGNSEKKGICHLLVNEGKITWVMNDN